MGDRQAHGLGVRVGASALNHRMLQLFGSRLPAVTGGWMPWLGMQRYPLPALPGPDWARLRPLMAGICGSDTSLLTGRASATLSPFASFPAVLGHEVVAVVEEAGSGVALAPGQRVAVDPVISCHVRGLEPCASCRDGLPALCLRAADGDLSPGMLIGYCRDLPGGWSDGMLAHASQLHSVPDQFSDEVAVLLEPLAIVLHAVLRDPPRAGDRMLVIGGGTIGLGAVAALRLIGADGDLTCIVRHPFQATLAERLGASRAEVDRDGGAAIRAAVETAGATPHRPLVGGPVLTGGFERIYDCVGTAASLRAALGAAAPRGRIVLVGTAFEVERLDLTLAWARELQVTGSYLYGREASVSGEPHTFDHLLTLLAAHPDLPVGELVTHRFPLARWRDALRVATGRGRHASVKVVFDHRPA
jgi:threonine dehydrogenase-like Zn-dependent dehydrogenase